MASCGKGKGRPPPPLAKSGERRKSAAGYAGRVGVPPMQRPKDLNPLCEVLSPDGNGLGEYRHKLRQENYMRREERFEPSLEEIQRIDDLVAAARNSAVEEMPVVSGSTGPRRIVIDTDVGTDADDVLALLTMLALPEEDVQVLGITTCYYPTLLRKFVAESILSKAGGRWAGVPVLPGPSHVCGTHRPVFIQGNEGEGLGLGLEAKKKLWSHTNEEGTETEEATRFLYETVKEYPKQVVIVCIGMATNVALCASRHAEFAALVGHVYVMMGGNPVTDRDVRVWNTPERPFSMPYSYATPRETFYRVTTASGDCSGEFKKHVHENGQVTIQNESGALMFKASNEWRLVTSAASKDDRSSGYSSRGDRADPPTIGWVSHSSVGDAITVEVVEEALDWLQRPGTPVTMTPNHNISGDTLATFALFKQSGCPITLIPNWITRQFYLEAFPGGALQGLLAAGAPVEWLAQQDWLRGQAIVERMMASRQAQGAAADDVDSLASICGRLFYEWINVRAKNNNKTISNGMAAGQCLHDPLTLCEALYFDKLTVVDSAQVRNGGVSVLTYARGTFVCHEWAGFLTFVPDPAGAHRVAVRASDPSAWIEWVNDTLLKLI
eukprot:TRINITY_DN16527_c0_g1_i1.p1 TRINITY_DN16527_c0_g1~~TRINITY_DN16527_c0_g1_i1.p1  ORF type:complete len:622 (-),score=94.26 TRINITY_DN16527_c0_g1_i1:51-1880(-)